MQIAEGNINPAYFLNFADNDKLYRPVKHSKTVKRVANLKPFTQNDPLLRGFQPQKQAKIPSKIPFKASETEFLPLLTRFDGIFCPNFTILTLKTTKNIPKMVFTFGILNVPYFCLSIMSRISAILSRSSRE